MVVNNAQLVPRKKASPAFLVQPEIISMHEGCSCVIRVLQDTFPVLQHPSPENHVLMDTTLQLLHEDALPVDREKQPIQTVPIVKLVLKVNTRMLSLL